MSGANWFREEHALAAKRNALLPRGSGPTVTGGLLADLLDRRRIATDEPAVREWEIALEAARIYRELTGREIDDEVPTGT